VFNSWHLTDRCLEALFANTRRELLREVIVVDDGSSDETRARLTSYPGVTAVLLPQNQGFARACNAGARQASGSLLFFLNNDCFAWDGAIEAMVAAMDDPVVGVVGARLLFGDGSIQHAGVAIINPGYWWHVYHHLDQRHPDANVPRDFAAVTGAAFLVRRDLLEPSGAFDERYRTGFEDVDFCLRTWHRGFRVRYEPRATFTHLESATQLHVPSNMVANAEKFSARWGPALEVLPHYELGALPAVSVFCSPMGNTAADQAGRQFCRTIALSGAPVVVSTGGLPVLPGDRPSVRLDWLELDPLPSQEPTRVAYVAPSDLSSARAVVHPSIDRYWAATAAARDHLIAAGADPLQVELLRVGVDPQLFTPSAPAMTIAAPAARIMIPLTPATPPALLADVFRSILPEIAAATGAVLLLTREPAEAVAALTQEALAKAGTAAAVPMLTLSTSQVADPIHPTLLNASDAILFVEPPDPVCFTVLAAMACARLIVAYDVTPIGEFLSNENALMTDAAGLSNAVREVLQRPVQFVERRKRARFDVERLYTTYFVIGHVRERLRLLGGQLRGAQTVEMQPAVARALREFPLPA
jgi:GT2 family glycosyltransferase